MANHIRTVGRAHICGGFGFARGISSSAHRSGSRWWFQQYTDTGGDYEYASASNSEIKHVLTMADLSRTEVKDIMKVAVEMKKSLKSHDVLRQEIPTSKWGKHYTGHDRFSDVLKGCSLLTLFEQPSLRTRIGLEIGMKQLGGQAIFYSTRDSALGDKESIEDAAKVLSRMCNGITARVKSRNALRALAAASSIPVVSALDDYGHPTQMLADLLTIMEHKGSWDGITMAYFGDLENNITYDLMRTAALMGYNLHLAGEGAIEQSVWTECEELSGGDSSKIRLFPTVEEAIKDVDVVYCDTWLSYGMDKNQEDERIKNFMPYQITADRMKLAKADSVFMNCLPAVRGLEQTAEVLDGPQSIVFDQAENALHATKAMLVYIMAPARFKRILQEI